MSDVERLLNDLRTLSIHSSSPAKAYQALQAAKVALLALPSMPPSTVRNGKELELISDR